MAAVCLYGSTPHRTARLLVLALGPQVVGRSVVVPLAVAAAAGLACLACHQVGLLAESRASIARAGGDADAAARPSVDDGYAGGALSLPRDRIMNPRHAHTVMLMLMLSHVEGVQGRLLAMAGRVVVRQHPHRRITTPAL